MSSSVSSRHDSVFTCGSSVTVESPPRSRRGTGKSLCDSFERPSAGNDAEVCDTLPEPSVSEAPFGTLPNVGDGLARSCWLLASLFLFTTHATSRRTSSPTLVPLSCRSSKVLLSLAPSSKYSPPSTRKSFHDKSTWVRAVSAANNAPKYLAPSWSMRLFLKSKRSSVVCCFNASQRASMPEGSFPMQFHVSFKLCSELFSLRPSARALTPFA
mmetsp:Transcript_60918/g.161778  ORF Transcript_60918/g.161778 Transcript_60918/m.161778 type:complete len:213 (-) Transcript_60918:204-842(-)